MTPWKSIEKIEQIKEIIELSKHTPCLIFKHSTRCSISTIAKHRLEDQWNFSDETLRPFYLDLIRYRAISDHIADVFEVHHESPQILLIRDGQCTYDASHLDIHIDELHECYEDAF